MSSRYDELERLQRLRESGALTDEEFQAEKRRLLGHQSVAPAEEAVDTAEPGSGRRLWIILGVAALVVAVVAGIFWGRMPGGGDDGIIDLPMPEENVAAEANSIQAPAPTDLRSLPGGEQLARAFQAAFGQAPPAARMVNGLEVAFAPGALRWAGSRAVLVSPGVSDHGCHACTGALAVHYLEPDGERFRVSGRWEDRIATGAYGRPPDWSLSTLLSVRPMVRTRLRDGNQGYFCASETFYELSPEGPRKIADIPIGYDDIGARGQAEGKKIEGKIINAVKDQSFDVVYSGSRAFSEHYVRGANGYLVAGGKSIMETCR